MKYLKYIVVLLSVLIVSCSSHTKLNDSQSNSRAFYIEEKALNEGVLRIHVPMNAPKNLAIKTQNGEWFVLQDSEESIEIMPQKIFESSTTLEFKVEKLQGVIWRDSKKVTELVFKKPGIYLIYFADNLETEPENTFSLQESIKFEPKY